MTIVVKKFIQSARDQGSDGAVDLVCTILQRPLLYKLAEVRRDGGSISQPFFPMRVNEGEDSAEACIELRSAKESVKCDAGGADAPAASATYAGRVEISSAWRRAPFQEWSNAANVIGNGLSSSRVGDADSVRGGRVVAPPRPRRGYFVKTSRGGAAAAARIYERDRRASAGTRAACR